MDVLGQIVLIGIENAQVRRADLRDWLAELEIGQDLLPRPASPVNAFRQATSGSLAQSYPAPWAGPAAVATVHWVVGSQTETTLTRQTRRVLRHSSIEPTPRTVAQAEFDLRPSPRRLRLTIAPGCRPEERPTLDRWLRDVRIRFTAAQSLLSADALRAIVRTHLTERLKALPLRPAVYFVRTADGIAQLRTLVERLSPDCSCQAYQILDEPGHRATLAKVLTSSLHELLLTTEQEAQVPAPRHHGKRRERLIARHGLILSQAHEYADLLLPDATGLLDDLSTAVARLHTSATAGQG